MRVLANPKSDADMFGLGVNNQLVDGWLGVGVDKVLAGLRQVYAGKDVAHFIAKL